MHYLIIIGTELAPRGANPTPQLTGWVQGDKLRQNRKEARKIRLSAS